MSNYEWRKNAKVGDKAIIRGRNRLDVCVVIKATKTQITVDFEGIPRRFVRDGGYEFGTSTAWHSDLIDEFDQKQFDAFAAKQEHARLVNELRDAFTKDATWRLSNAQIIAFTKALKGTEP